MANLLLGNTRSIIVERPPRLIGAATIGQSLRSKAVAGSFRPPRVLVKRGAGIFTLSRGNFLPLASLLAGVTLRVALACVNRQANDDHIEVVLKLLADSQQPSISTCNECFQPKLFHLLCAWIATACHLSTRDEIAVAAQLLNVVSGTGVLLIGYAFVSRLSADPWVRFLATSWLALNPGLLAINVQATNDTLIILAGTVLLVSLQRWVRSGGQNTASLLVVLLSSGLAPHIKGNGIVLAALTVGILIAITLLTSRSHRCLRSIAVFLVFASIVLLGARLNRSYQDNYKATGRWLPINMAPAPAPFLFRHTVVNRPGVTSIVSAFLTFRILDLVKTPFITEAVTPHRTSLWSQLYGRTYFLHFDQWPRSWQQRSRRVQSLGRVLLVLGLFPTWVLVAGVTDVIRRPRRLELESLVFLLFVGAMLAFLVAYSIRYRDMAVMKAVFVFPALLAFVYFYVEGLHNRITRRPLRTTLVLTHVAMLSLWVVEEVHLLNQLMTRPV